MTSDLCYRRNVGNNNLMYWYAITRKTIIANQDPITGLIPSYPGGDTWVRDCTYAVHSIWALSVAFEKHPQGDRLGATSHELRLRTVKAMQGLLNCFMTQKDKLTKFIETECFSDCLHAKYSTTSGQPVVGDTDWGHLQLDATALFLLTLAQITSSGYIIVQSLSEVKLVQKLVLYVHLAYRTPDFGVYERGDKNNRGIREMSACSVGMAKAALVAVRDLNLFGGKGGPSSIIHVPPDMSRTCNNVLESILPRGSKSKEFDSSILAILSYPAFSVESDILNSYCKDLLTENLKGTYGFKRFLLDGYKCPLEDNSRLHYEMGELKNFANIECEWPIYLVYEWIDEIFNGDLEAASKLKDMIEQLVVIDEEGFPLLPELYFLPSDKINAEREDPGSQSRLCGGKIPFLWGQSLFILANLLHSQFLSISDIDPLNRRLSVMKQPVPIVQVLLFSADEQCQNFAELNRIPCMPIVNEIFHVISPSVVSKIWEELGLSYSHGDESAYYHNLRKVSSLQTSIVYQYKGKNYISLPEYSLKSSSYSMLDHEMFIQETVATISYLSSQWYVPGRPVLGFLLTSENCKEDSTLRFLTSVSAGSYQGIQVKLCSAEDALCTSFKKSLCNLPIMFTAQNGCYQLWKDDAMTTECDTKVCDTKGELMNKPSELSAKEKLKILTDRFSATGQNIDTSFLQETYQAACQEKDWYSVRHCSVLLHQVHRSFCDDVTHILVNQNQISFGIGADEQTISQPPTGKKVLELLNQHSKERTIFFALYQEILSYLCQIAKKKRELFRGIPNIRLGFLIKLIAKETSGNDCDFEEMCAMRPVELHNLVYQLFSGGVTENEYDSLSWERRRYIDGSLNRVPINFYPKLYLLLSLTSGINLNGNFLKSFPIINEMTEGEPQFATTISTWLEKTPSPQIRQLYVEVIMMLGSLVKPTDKLPIEINLHKVLEEAHKLFKEDINWKVDDGSLGGLSQEFLATPPTGQYGTLTYIAQAVALVVLESSI